MDAPQHRDLVRRTAEDFEWLEAHCRTRSELAQHAGELRLAAALTRNVLGPALDGVVPPPLFIAVVGGAGAGKSTAVNFLVGRPVAEANPQAGYTRHPIAFLNESATWPPHLAFLGPLRRLERDASSNLDDDVYQVHRLPNSANDPLKDFIVWDCPDMTTWASSGYASRLIEIAALADVIVNIASDERYNDEVPTQFLQLMLRSGKAVVVALTKMKPENVETITTHFRNDVLHRITDPATSTTIPIIAIPHLDANERNDPGGAGAKWRAALLNPILVICPSPAAARQRTSGNAMKFLEAASDNLLDVARRDLAELDAWKAAVRSGQTAFVQRYRNEYLAGEPFKRFERTREEALRMLEMPGGGRTVSAVLQTLRWPVEWLVKKMGEFVARPDPPNQPERAVLSSAMTAWLDSLQAESLRRSSTHSLWKQMAHGFDAGLKGETQAKFDDAARTYELQETGDLEASARHVSESLANQPSRLSLLRGGKIALEIAVILLAVWLNFHFESSFWNLIWIIPLAAYAGHALTDAAVRFAVERSRRQARQQREELLAKTITEPLATWLESKPISGGSPVERLQAIVQRVPEAIRILAAALRTPGAA